MSLRILFKFPCPIHKQYYKNFHEKWIFWKCAYCGDALFYLVDEGDIECQKCQKRFEILRSRFNCDKKIVFSSCLDDDEKEKLRQELRSTTASFLCFSDNSDDEYFILKQIRKYLDNLK